MKLKKLSKLSKIILGLTFLTGAYAQAQEKITIGTEGAYPPFNMVNNKGELEGFDVDIAKALCKEMKVECKFVVQDWDGLIPALQVKKIDAIVASMSKTPERLKVVDFTDKYYSNKIVFMAAKKSSLGKDLSKIKGKTLGSQRATVSARYLEDKLGKTNKIKFYDSQELVYLDLTSGRIDGLMMDLFPALDWLKSADGKDYEIKGDAISISDDISIAIRKSDGKLKQRFNQAIKAIVANGEYKKINDKYFPFSAY